MKSFFPFIAAICMAPVISFSQTLDIPQDTFFVKVLYNKTNVDTFANCFYRGYPAVISATLSGDFEKYDFKITWQQDSSGHSGVYKNIPSNIPPDSAIQGDKNYLLADFPGNLGDSTKFRVKVEILSGPHTGEIYWSSHVTICHCGVLPILVESFFGSAHGTTINLNWTIADDLNTKFFVVQRSLDGYVFTNIAIFTIEGTLNQGKSYQLKDELTNISTKYVFYRLEITSIDGKVTFSSIIKIGLKGGQNASISIGPNPATTQTRIFANLSDLGSSIVQIVDLQGRTIYTQNFGNGLINLTNVSKGIYVLKMTQKENIFITKLIKK